MRAETLGGISANCGSAAVISLTSSMMAATEVLKCQRPAKSCVILRMVWCSLRRSFCAAGDAGAALLRSGRAARTCPAVTHPQAIDPAEKAADAGHPVFLPVEIAIGRRGKERIDPGSVGAIAGDHVVGRNHVALGLGHLRAILDHHSLGKEALRRFVVLDKPKIAHHLGPETRVDQVQNGVLDAADVLIDGEPVRDLLRTEGRARVLRVRVAIEVPGRVDKGVHRIGLAPRRAAALGTDRVHERRDLGQRASRPAA